MKTILILGLFLFSFFPVDIITQEKKDDQTLVVDLKIDYSALKFEKNSAELFDLFLKVSRLIEEANKKSYSFSVFKEKKKEIIELLKKAAGISPDLQYGKYLNSLSESLLNDNYTSSISNWLKIKERIIDFIIISPEKQKKISFFLLKSDQIISKKFEKYISIIDKMMANSTMKNTSSPIKGFVENPFLFFDLIYSPDINRFVLIHPDQIATDYKNSGFKIIFFKNIVKLYFDKILKPISELVLTDQLKRFVEFDAYLSNIIMHRISHTLGPFIVESKSEDLTSPQDKLKDLFYCIEEVKADVVSLCNISVLLKEKLISSKNEKSMFVLFVVHLLEKIRNNTNSNEKKPFLVLFNYILKKEGVIYNINKQELLINFPKLKVELESLMNEVIQIERSGNYNKAKNFIENYALVTEVINMTLKKVDKIPKKLKIVTN